jgi:hypothetical protein
MIGFMCHVAAQSDLFPTADLARFWRDLIDCLNSGKQMIITCRVDSENRLGYEVTRGAPLPSGKAALTRFGQRL